MFRWSLLLLMGLASAAAAGWKETFPRLGGMNIGAKTYHEQWYIDQISKLDLVVLGFYEGYRGGPDGQRAILQTIKAKNPKIKVAQYHALFQTSALGDATIAKFSGKKGPGCKNTDWFSRGPDGNILLHTHDTKAYELNLTRWVQPDAEGNRLPQYLAKRFAQLYYMPQPEFDFVYIDTYNPKYSSFSKDGDYDGNCVLNKNEPDQEALNKEFRANHIAFSDALRTHTGRRVVMVNNSDWMIPGHHPLPPEYVNQVEGGYMEHVAGRSWSVEGSGPSGEQVNTWGSWKLFMDSYKRSEEVMKQPKLVLVNALGDKTNYKLMRYMFASTLMRNGYFSYTANGELYRSVPWYDEFGIDLGRALTGPVEKPWQKGVWRRDFEKGIVLVNPRKNGAQTVTLEKPYQKIRGVQAPGFNDGSRVTNLTLQDADGIILLSVDEMLSLPSIPENARLKSSR